MERTIGHIAPVQIDEKDLYLSSGLVESLQTGFSNLFKSKAFNNLFKNNQIPKAKHLDMTAEEIGNMLYSIIDNHLSKLKPTKVEDNEPALPPRSPRM